MSSETGRKTRNGGVTFVPEGPVSRRVWNMAAELRVLADSLGQDAQIGRASCRERV